ncbi:MAG: hypothetical protein JXB07_17920 [Anaerolineae bacterium]|nr:hypothetical protein [Anaerolineae bacterium]
MTLSDAMSFTLNYLFRADMWLNWFLGCVLCVFPSFVDGLINLRPFLPLLVYWVVGVGFLLFAAWQTIVVVRRQLGPGELVFAAVMAEIPVVLLTVALISMSSALHPVWYVVLWVGDGYMLFLGAWYIFLARRMVIEKASG